MPHREVFLRVATFCALAVLALSLPQFVHAATNTVYLTSGSSWTVPSTWNSSNNSIQVIGGGAGGGGGGAFGTAWAGGGGGAYSSVSNLSLSPGSSIYYAIGYAGAGGSGGSGGAGSATYFNGYACGSSSVCAQGGGFSTGGIAGSGVGTVRHSGGTGASGAGTNYSCTGAGGCPYGGGGGGAAGPGGGGANGSSYLGGASGGGSAGYGGNGGSDQSGGNAYAYGGGGGGAGGAGSYGGSGVAGVIVITWVDPHPASCSVGFDSNPIAYGGGTTLRWTSTNADYWVYISNIGYVGSSGAAWVAPLLSTNYSYTCSGYGGNDIWRNAWLTVNAPANCTFNGSTVNHGASVTAYQSPSVPYNQTCNSQTRTCNNGSLSGNYNHQNCTVSNPPPTCALSLNPTAVTQGTPSTLSWSSTDATSCTGNNFSTGGATSGSVSVTPSQSTTYTASCTRPGSSTAQCTGTGSGGKGATLTVSCTPTYTCTGAGSQTISYTNDQCQTSTVTTCVSPQFCSPGSSACLTPSPSGSISASSLLVHFGDTVEITWSTNDTVSCTISGNGDTWTGTSGSDTSSPITDFTTYTISCDDLDADVLEDDLIDSISIFSVPDWFEI